MYTHFRFSDGSNPFITINNKALFEMFCNYDTVQEMEQGFYVIGARQTNGNRYKLTYQDKKNIARATAQSWQDSFSCFCYSWDDLANWANFFEYIGEKFGLIKEFRENGIL